MSFQDVLDTCIRAAPIRKFRREFLNLHGIKMEYAVGEEWKQHVYRLFRSQVVLRHLDFVYTEAEVFAALERHYKMWKCRWDDVMAVAV